MGAPPEGLERVVADGHAGSQIQLLEFGAELAEADAGAVRDLGAAVQVQHFDVPAVLGKGSVQEQGVRTGRLLGAAQEPGNIDIQVIIVKQLQPQSWAGNKTSEPAGWRPLLFIFRRALSYGLLIFSLSTFI